MVSVFIFRTVHISYNTPILSRRVSRIVFHISATGFPVVLMRLFPCTDIRRWATTRSRLVGGATRARKGPTGRPLARRPASTASRAVTPPRLAQPRPPHALSAQRATTLALGRSPARPARRATTKPRPAKARASTALRAPTPPSPAQPKPRAQPAALARSRRTRGRRAARRAPRASTRRGRSGSSFVPLSCGACTNKRCLPQGRAVCTPCSAGTYFSETGSTAASDCVSCGAGKILCGNMCNAETEPLVVSGTYALTGAPTCTKCSSGSYQQGTGASACILTLAGTFVASRASVTFTSW